MTRTRDENGVEIVLFDEAVLLREYGQCTNPDLKVDVRSYHVDIRKALSSIRAPMSQ